MYAGAAERARYRSSIQAKVGASRGARRAQRDNQRQKQSEAQQRMKKKLDDYHWVIFPVAEAVNQRGKGITVAGVRQQRHVGSLLLAVGRDVPDLDREGKGQESKY